MHKNLLGVNHYSNNFNNLDFESIFFNMGCDGSVVIRIIEF